MSYGTFKCKKYRATDPLNVKNPTKQISAGYQIPLNNLCRVSDSTKKKFPQGLVPRRIFPRFVMFHLAGSETHQEEMKEYHTLYFIAFDVDRISI